MSAPARRAPASASLDPEARFKRNALLAILAIAMVTSALTLTFARYDMAASDELGLTLLIAKNVILFWWLKRVPRAFAFIGFLHFFIGAVAGMTKFAQALLIDQTAYGLGSYSYWLPMSYVVAFVVFNGRKALGASLAVYGAFLLTGVAFWLSPAVPLAVKQANTGLLIQVYLTHATFISIFVCLGVLLARHMEAIREAEREAHFANVDALTGLPNRRQLTAWLTTHALQARATGEPLSVILFDLDHFKRVNDTFGHDVGDRVLQGTAQAVIGTLRRGTLFGRWGGEEFLLILPNADAQQAAQAAERVKTALGFVVHDHAGRVTASCGAAQVQPGESVERLLKRADKALYAAKDAGRDCVRVA